MKLPDFYNKKQNHEKITMLTCYDYTSARILADTSVDCLLVGDSVATTLHGFKDTLSATLAMMKLHTAAVRRGAEEMFIISDLPFLSYRGALSDNVAAVHALMQAGADAVKLEGAAGNESLVKHLVQSGVPVMGHIGLTPQFVHILGGYKVQGKTTFAAHRLLEDARALQEAGCFALVLECIPAPLAQEITQALTIPTLGIGAGPFTDGQILVWQDLLGLNDAFKPRFVKHFLNGSELFKNSIEQFVSSVKQGEFPEDGHCY